MWASYVDTLFFHRARRVWLSSHPADWLSARSPGSCFLRPHRVEPVQVEKPHFPLLHANHVEARRRVDGHGGPALDGGLERLVQARPEAREGALVELLRE